MYLLFRRLNHKRQLNGTVNSPSQAPMQNIWYLNENDSQEAGIVSTLSLNKQFQLIQCGSAAELAKSIKITLYVA
jgi:hypothetical protein